MHSSKFCEKLKKKLGGGKEFQKIFWQRKS